MNAQLQQQTNHLFSILIVDDNVTCLTVYHKYLKELGYRVLSTYCSHQALDLNEAIEFDLMIVDIELPLMNGVELIKKVRKKRPDIKVLFMSGMIKEQVVDNLLSSAEYFLEKPFGPDQLLTTIENILGKLRNEYGIVKSG